MRHLVMVGLIGCAESEGPLGVNEVASHVTTGITDDAGEVSDWLELLNQDEVARTLDGWRLTVGSEHYTFPSGTTLASGELAMVWCDAEPDQGPLHAPFTLPEDAFALTVTDADGVLVQDISVPETAADRSFGRVPDQAPNWQLTDPTPGALNRP